MRIDHHFAGTSGNVDKRGYNLVQDLLAGKHAMLRDGIVKGSAHVWHGDCGASPQRYSC